ncbi:MAG: 50S ribosomal protein L29 [Oligoflexia bacterium]|nr:50S ribosomal protein L29 [Oligoflexia bacterium]
MSKMTELRKLSIDDLKAKSKDLKEDIFKIRMQVFAGSVTDKHAVVSKRRELARAKTALNEKLGGNK